MHISSFIAAKCRANGRLLVRAFRYRNCRLFFAGQILSLTGTWMQHTAMSWLVYRLTGSAFLLGFVVFSGQLFSFLLTPVAGVLADRVERRSLLLWTQFLAMLQALAIFVLLLTDSLQTWHLVALSVVLGMVTSFEVPARHSFIADIVDDKGDLVNAVALNASMFHAARLVGPAAAGVLIGAAGEGPCFLLNAVSFGAVILALAAIRVKPRPGGAARQPVMKDFMASVGYVAGALPIRSIIMLTALIGLAGMPLTVLLPVFARDVIGGGPEALGLLMASSGLGALVGTLYLAARGGSSPIAGIMGKTAILLAAGMIAFTLSTTLWLSLVFLFAAGFGMVTLVAAGNAVIQTIVEENMRGRVMALFNMAFLGMSPVGSLLSGLLANRMGVQFTLLLDAAFFLAFSRLFIRRIAL
jgi:MFS family permease